ncbi:putative permease YjgP/YjgQ family protein [Planctomycetes bacterium Poly30]|uniref:Putative permease YjgP/YjgQ family protein n=1 Tax=Saltatorellus ferox TaxID=2528018 RepID=A0A518EZV3_9BACT|nr:putative permease YjgP/YjgQ family protein [Planctomycetes bacterium Poly30]
MTIHLYVLKQLLIALAFAVGALLCVALPGIAISTVTKLPSVDVWILLRFLPLVLQSLTPYMLPLCFVLSVVAVFGRLASDGEWTAILMTGRHPLTLLIAPGVVATLLGLVIFGIVSNDLPQLRKKERALILAATNSFVQNLRPGKTSIDIAGLHLIARTRDMDTGTFRGVYLRHAGGSDDQLDRVDIFANSVDISVHGELLRVHAVGIGSFDSNSGSYSRSDELLLNINIAKRLGVRTETYERARYLTSTEIRERLETAELTPKRLRDYRYTLQYRAALAGICFVFAALGSGIGVLMRRGSLLTAMAVSVGFGLVYYVCNMELGGKLGHNPDLPPWLGAWITNAASSLVAAFFLRRAIRR